MSRSSYAFTLLEMMIALIILSLIGALCAVPIKKLSDSHRFENEVSDLFIALQEAQVLASTYQTDISLDFYRKKGKFHYRFSTDEPFTTRQLNREDRLLSYTCAIRFQGKKVDKLHLDIFSGRVEPRGILTFFQKSEEDSKALWFDLQYGQLLKFSYHKPALAKQQIQAQP
jgi:prepilin-type N-terminal cleavage/methylation domain-containing protein